MILDPNKREQVIPMPVVLISTASKEGIRNIAPYANVMPILRPWDLISFASWIKRDTLDNIRETKEFVINVPSADLVEEVMICSRNYPKEVDEFVEAKLEEKTSKKIKAPSIEGCIAWMECILDKEIIEEGKYSIIIGKVVYLEANNQYFKNGDMDFEAARPLSMMAGDEGMYYTMPKDTGDYRKYSEMFIGNK